MVEPVNIENEWNFMLIRPGDDKSLENPVVGELVQDLYHTKLGIVVEPQDSSITRILWVPMRDEEFLIQHGEPKVEFERLP